jgi:hypothetical protein
MHNKMSPAHQASMCTRLPQLRCHERVSHRPAVTKQVHTPTNLLHGLINTNAAGASGKIGEWRSCTSSDDVGTTESRLHVSVLLLHLDNPALLCVKLSMM